MTELICGSIHKKISWLVLFTFSVEKFLNFWVVLIDSGWFYAYASCRMNRWSYSNFTLLTEQVLVSIHQVMYRPLKDLDGIPGAKDLLMCLTGYIRQDREDVMVSICYALLC